MNDDDRDSIGTVGDDEVYRLTSLVKLGVQSNATGDKSTRFLGSTESERRLIEAYITTEYDRKE